MDGAVAVVAIGKWLASRWPGRELDRPIVDLAGPTDQHAQARAAAPPRRFLVVADGSEASFQDMGRPSRRFRPTTRPVAVDLLDVQRP